VSYACVLAARIEHCGFSGCFLQGSPKGKGDQILGNLQIINENPILSGAVIQACKPSYLEGGDLEDCGLRPAQAKCLGDPISTSGWAQWHMPVTPAM
jgi:hypothetical protein